MIFFIWNMRGFGQRDRRRQLRQFLRQTRVDVIGIQETIRSDFSDAELASLVGGLPFVWHWIPAVGLSGGILIGANSESFEVGQIDSGSHFASLQLHQRDCNFKWEAIVVYGPANHRGAHVFLEELSSKVRSSSLPVVVAGDFNLTRSPADNSNGNFDPILGNLFNDWIADQQLREIPRLVARPRPETVAPR